MRGRRLLDAMAYIDDDLIEDAAFLAENDSLKPVPFFEKRIRRRQLAACAAVLFVTAVSLWVWQSGSKVYEEIASGAGNSDNGAYARNAEALVAAPGAAPAEAEAAPAEAAPGTVQENNAVSGKKHELEAANRDDVLTDGVEDKKYAVTEGEADTQQQKGPLRVRIIEEFPQTAIACYATPKKGEFFQSIGLMAAIDCWDNGNNTMDIAEPESYLYRVEIDVFGDVNKDNDVSYEVLDFSDEGKEKLNKEYERLLDLGLEVKLSEEFELTGLLSRDEIEGFEPSPEYGYMFRLVNESE